MNLGDSEARNLSVDLTPERRGLVALALSALSDETRSEIMRVLASTSPRGLSAPDISLAVGLDQRTTLRHLSILRRAKLVRETRIGRNRHYSADKSSARDCLSFVHSLVEQLGLQ